MGGTKNWIVYKCKVQWMIWGYPILEDLHMFNAHPMCLGTLIVETDVFFGTGRSSAWMLLERGDCTSGEHSIG